MTDAKRTDGKSRFTMAGLFVAAFILAFGLAWVLFRRDTPSPAPTAPAAPVAVQAPARDLTPEDMKDFCQAAERGDFAALRKLGGELFGEGRAIPGSEGHFAKYAVNSFPPHRVYAFLTRLGPEKTSRVMLVIDEKDKIVSFLAEEMSVVQ